MDHNYKDQVGFQVGDVVRVDEALPGQPAVYWKGEIVKIHTMGTIANVKDVNPNSSYFSEIFPRRIEGQLFPWNLEDDINV